MSFRSCTLTLPAASLVVGALLIAAAGDGFAQSAPERNERVERGRYLVSTSGCHDCHTPFKMGANGPEPDLSRMLSGHPESLVMPPVPALPPGPWMTVSAATNTAHAGPWGVSFSANLTPEADTGLGRWSQKDFIDTIRTGRHMGKGRPVLPPMPVPVTVDGSIPASSSRRRTTGDRRAGVPAGATTKTHRSGAPCRRTASITRWTAVAR